MPELAYVNGRFCSLDEAVVSIEDRGFQFGDGVYEVLFVYNGQPFLLDDHLARLVRSCAGIELDYDFANAPLEPVIEEGLERSGLSNAMVYVQVTRGVAPRSHVIPGKIEPTVVMTFKTLPVVPHELRRAGAKMMTIRDTRWANCYIKAITLLPNVLARNEAVRRGYDDAIFVTSNGEVRECTSANIFVVRGVAIRTPPLTESVLHGVTQKLLRKCARGIELDVQEARIAVDELCGADEVFMSSTAVEVLGVTSIDDRPIGNGRVGPITERLHAEFLRRVR